MTDPGEVLAEADAPTRSIGWARFRPGHPWHFGVRLLVATVCALAGAGLLISTWPYRSSVAGVQIVVNGSVTPARRGLTVDSSLGALQFRHVTALPVGLHVTPRIDLETVRSATDGGAAFTARARADLEEQAPRMIMHFAGTGVFGLLIGALAGGLLVDGAFLLLTTEDPHRLSARRQRVRSTAVLVSAVTVVAAASISAVGGFSYRSDWYTRYAVTGLLADVAATPARLAELDARDASAANKIRAVLRLEAALTQPPPDRIAPPTAFTVMFISDVHRRDIYHYLQQYIDANDVQLIVNTGDETLFGNTNELTPDYLASIKTITASTPMVWVKGNHDSSGVAKTMASIPGVTVLDEQILPVYGLQIYGVADPRTFGASGDAGSNTPAVITRFVTAAAEKALAGLNRQTYVDLLLAHEPFEADALAGTLGPSVRAQASGHVHRQNAEDDLQTDDRDDIRLVEGTTGLGGLLANTGDAMEFSVMSVAANCQFTRIIRYQLADPALPDATRADAFGNSSSFNVHYFRPQPVAADRTCSVADGVGEVGPADSTDLRTAADWASGPVPESSSTAVITPEPVTSEDEAGDDSVRSPTPSSDPDPSGSALPEVSATPPG